MLASAGGLTSSPFVPARSGCIPSRTTFVNVPKQNTPVRSPRHVVTVGKTPAFEAVDARALFTSIDPQQDLETWETSTTLVERWVLAPLTVGGTALRRCAAESYAQIVYLTQNGA